MYKLNKEVRIAISGKSGCGNTTVSSLLAKILDITLINYTFRQMAAERNMTLAEVIEAAKKARIHDAIVLKELGYDTKLGVKGAGLSGGEKQRIAIARAILNKPQLYILDEATSSLDTVTEKQIQEELAELTKDKTTFIIAHRLSTLKNADRLIVLDNGKIVEIGSHKELIDKKGYYYQLVNAQYMTYQKKAEEDLD